MAHFRSTSWPGTSWFPVAVVFSFFFVILILSGCDSSGPGTDGISDGPGTDQKSDGKNEEETVDGLVLPGVFRAASIDGYDLPQVVAIAKDDSACGTTDQGVEFVINSLVITITSGGDFTEDLSGTMRCSAGGARLKSVEDINFGVYIMQQDSVYFKGNSWITGNAAPLLDPDLKLRPKFGPPLFISEARHTIVFKRVGSTDRVVGE